MRNITLLHWGVKKERGPHAALFLGRVELNFQQPHTNLPAMIADVTYNVCNLRLQACVTQVTCRCVLPAVSFSALEGLSFGIMWHPNEVPAELGSHRSMHGLVGLGEVQMSPLLWWPPLCMAPAQGTAGTGCLHHPHCQRGRESAGSAGGEISCFFLGRYP